MASGGVQLIEYASWLVRPPCTSAVAWLQLVHVDRTSKLNPQVWSLFVVATMCGMVAYVVSVVRTSDLVLGSLSGLGCVGGGLLILAALTVKRPAKS